MRPAGAAAGATTTGEFWGGGGEGEGEEGVMPDKPHRHWTDVWTHRKRQVNRDILRLLEARGDFPAQKECLVPHALIPTAVRRQSLAQRTELFDETCGLVLHVDRFQGCLAKLIYRGK
jgi:hypothetical protein